MASLSLADNPGLILDIEPFIKSHTAHLLDTFIISPPNPKHPRWLFIIRCHNEQNPIYYTLPGRDYTSAEHTAATKWIKLVQLHHLDPRSTSTTPARPPVIPPPQAPIQTEDHTSGPTHQKRKASNCTTVGCHKKAATAIGSTQSSYCQWAITTTPVCLEHCKVKSAAAGKPCRLSNHRVPETLSSPMQNTPAIPTPYTPQKKKNSATAAPKDTKLVITKDTEHIPVFPLNYFDRLPPAQLSPNASDRTPAEARDARQRQDRRRTICLFYFLRDGKNVSDFSFTNHLSFTEIKCLLFSGDNWSNRKHQLPDSKLH